MKGRAWAYVGLAAILILDVWWRCHTIGPTIRAGLGIDLYPVTGAEAEPLDCDEAVYAFMGQRITRGSVLYRDMTENKPPAGYWAYALAVGLGGASETTVRLMPVPLVLATIALVWWLGLRLRGPGTACVGALSYAIVSADPFLYANGANMEHILNLAAVGSLAFLVAGWERGGRWRLVAAGACLGAASLVKQVAVIHGPIYAAALLGRRSAPYGVRTWRDRVLDVAALTAGFLGVVALAAIVLIAQGAGRAAYDDVVRYGAASATDIPVDPKAPPALVRWVTGNADPEGRLPPPFGTTNYLVWWGQGSWPFWLAAAPALVWLAFGPGATATRRLVAAWTLSAWVQVALPRHFWAHYYLLPVPGMAVAVAVLLCDLIQVARSGKRRVAASLGAAAVAAALVGTAIIQCREYLGVAPEELTIRHKGGRQWVVLRGLGRELARRSGGFARPTLFIWGWQSPLYFYSGLQPVTPQLFADDLIRAHAGSDHPLIRPRVERMMSDLRADPPALVFAGYVPFPALRAFLSENYLPSRLAPVAPDGRGLWVLKRDFGAFESGR
jgi:4-amino-4-deoxy-L-arabinose transferase-like glycosyltransferase